MSRDRVEVAAFWFFVVGTIIIVCLACLAAFRMGMGDLK